MEVSIQQLRSEIAQLSKAMLQMTDYAHGITKHLAMQDEKLDNLALCINLLLPKEKQERKVSFVPSMPTVSSSPALATISANEKFVSNLVTCKSSPSIAEDAEKETAKSNSAADDATASSKLRLEKKSKHSRLRTERHIKRKAERSLATKTKESKGLPSKKVSCESGVFSADDLITDDISDEVIYESALSDNEINKGLEITVTVDSESSIAASAAFTESHDALNESGGDHQRSDPSPKSSDINQTAAQNRIPETPNTVVTVDENITATEQARTVTDTLCDVKIHVADTQQHSGAHDDKADGKNNLTLNQDHTLAQGRRASYAGLTVKQKQAIGAPSLNAENMTPAHMENGERPRCSSSCEFRTDTPKSDAGDVCADRRLFEVKRQFSNTSTESAPGGIHLTIPSMRVLDSEDDEVEIKLPSPPAPKFNHRVVNVKSSTYKHFYELKEPIGGGRFGRVYRCVEKKTGVQLAAKCFQCKKQLKTSLSKANSLKKAKLHLKTKRTEQEPVGKEDVLTEIAIMNQIDHENIVKLYDAYENDNQMTLIIEYMGGGELFERVILDQSQLTELDAILFMRQISRAVQYLHKNLILHLDLKPENILCLDRSTHHLKIIDFGLARKYNPRQKLMVQWGTPEFMAPEILNYESVSSATDMWSVGVICYILLSGISPFLGDTDGETMENIMDIAWEFEEEHFDDVSADAKDFISRLLVEEKSGRLSAAQCLRHKWLSTPLTSKRRKALMNKKQLKNFMARIHWKASIAAVTAANWLRQQIVPTDQSSSDATEV
ncbi:uncharacterized protein LOC100177233 [Ciona intestinalis]